MSGPGALCVGARRSLCQAPALSVSGPGALCVRPRRCLCRGPALSVSGPGAVCVGARRSLCQAPALSVSGPGAVCGAALSVSGPGSLCVVAGARRSPRRCLFEDPALSVSALSGSAGSSLSRSLCGALPPSLSLFVLTAPKPQLRSACSSACHLRSAQGSAAPSSDPRAAPIRVPPIRSRGPPAQIRVPPIERTPNLTVWGNMIIPAQTVWAEIHGLNSCKFCFFRIAHCAISR